MSNIIGVVLTGGLSRRMDRPKALLRMPNGSTFLQNALMLLSRLTSTQIVAGGEPKLFGKVPPSHIHVEDLHPGEGPLAGIEAALATGLGDGYLIVATDQPRLSPSILRQLLVGNTTRIHAFEVDGSVVPLPIYVPQSALTSLEELMKSKRRAIRAFITADNPELISLTPGYLNEIRSVNTPEEYQLFLSESGQIG